MLSLLLLLGAIEVGEWSAPACPPALLTPRVRGDVSGVRVSVHDRGGGVLVGSLEVSRDGKTRRRTHEATSCEALIDVLALGVNLAATKPSPLSPVGERNRVRAPAEQKEEAPQLEVASAPREPIDATPPIIEPPPPVEPVEPVAVAILQPIADPPPPPPIVEAPVTLLEPQPPAPAASSSVDVGAHALFVFGASPAPAFGAELSASWLPLDRLFRVELSLQHARTATVGLGPGRGRFSLTTARLGVCSPTLHIGPATAGVCASFAAGAVWAQGFPTTAIVAAREVTLPWFDGSAQARLAVELGRGFTLEGRAGPTFPFNRHTFVFEQPRLTVYTVSVVGFEGGLGLSFTP